MSIPADSTFGSAHNILLKINGQKVGSCRSISLKQEFGTEGAYVIGSIMPAEHVPHKWSGPIDCDKFFIRKDLAAAVANFEVSGEGVLYIEPLDIEVIDKANGKTVFVAQTCTVVNTDITISANAFIGERATFLPLGVKREKIGIPIMESGLIQ
jgi:hypothetical protein